MYLLTKMEEKRRKARGLLEELEKRIISLINFGLLLVSNFYRLRIKKRFGKVFTFSQFL